MTKGQPGRPAKPRSGPLIRTERDGPVAILTFSRPESANSLDNELSYALLTAVRALRDADDVRAMVITGTGTVFSGGGDVATIQAMREDREARTAMLSMHGELFWEMTRLPFPTVAAVNGPAIGAAVTVALLCDLVVLAEDAYLSDPRVSLGLLDGAGGLLLWPMLTGLSAAREHLLLGDRVSAAEAHRLGLASRISTSTELMNEATRLAHRLARLPAPAVRELRRLLNIPLEQAAEHLREASRVEFDLFDTPEHRTLVAQFADRMAARSRPQRSDHE